MTLEFTGSKPLIHHVYTDMITPLENLDKAGEAYPEKDLRKDKERYVTALVNYPCKEEIRMMTLR